jgi:L-arabinose isomerase
MRQVAVTEGDKVEAQIRFGVEVNGYSVGDLAKGINDISEREIDRLVQEYDQQYAVAESMRSSGPRRGELRYAARIELGLRAFMEKGRFGAFSDSFEDLTGIEQLPGIAVQRLVADGYGFGAEGDWKTAALTRALKIMAAGLPGGTSFMEDYTYHLHPQGTKVLGAHMLEICPSLAADKPSCEIHPLGIGGKKDPVRLVFSAAARPAINVALIDLGDRFRLLYNEIDGVVPDQPLPNLPVARAFWTPRPDLKAAAWIYAGGPHHFAFSQALSGEHIDDFAEMAGVECLRIDGQTRISDFTDRLRWNQAFYSRG